MAGASRAVDTNAELYADLLRKAKGDGTVAERWMTELIPPTDGAGALQCPRACKQCHPAMHTQRFSPNPFIQIYPCC